MSDTVMHEGEPTRADLTTVVGEAARCAELVAPGGAALCLPVTAAICRVLDDAGHSDIAAVAGSYDNNAHWWVRAGDLFLDATRHQFGVDLPLICPMTEAGYEIEGEFPPGWTDEHIELEALRVFVFRAAGRRFARDLLGRLRQVMPDTPR